MLASLHSLSPAVNVLGVDVIINTSCNHVQVHWSLALSVGKSRFGPKRDLQIAGSRWNAYGDRPPNVHLESGAMQVQTRVPPARHAAHLTSSWQAVYQRH